MLGGNKRSIGGDDQVVVGRESGSRNEGEWTNRGRPLPPPLNAEATALISNIQHRARSHEENHNVNASFPSSKVVSLSLLQLLVV